MEPEPYLDIVLTDWLPRRQDSKIGRALGVLAGLLKDRHGDPWLRDVLRDLLASRSSQRMERGLAALAAAVRANLADEPDRALAEARAAAADLRAAGNPAGELRAQTESVYALHRSLQSVQCVEDGGEVERLAGGRNYAWIVGQVRIEEGICRARLGDSGGAHHDMERALEGIRKAGYAMLELRAAGILAGERTNEGNLLISWAQSREVLERYWSGPHPPDRANQICVNLRTAAEYLQFRETAYILARAGASAMAETSRRLAEASGRASAAQLARAAGRPEEARQEYGRAARLLAQLEGSETARSYALDTELMRAEAEIGEGALADALKRLRKMEPEVDRVQALLIRLRFWQALGEALRLQGELKQAEAAYRAAIGLSEQRLRSLGKSDDRAAAIAAAGTAYRGLAQILWDRDGDVKGALRIWEWFRAGERPRGGPGLEELQRALRRETILSYAKLPGGMAVWVFDDRGIEGRRLAVQPEELQTTAERFARLCADPASDEAALRRDSRQLYEWLVAPVESRLETGRTLVVEPDGAIAAIPVQALLDSKLRYMGQRYATVFASSVADYQDRAAARPVDSSSRALIVANPALSKDAALAFPPLAQTLREGRTIANRFSQAVLLIHKEATPAAVERRRPAAEVFHFAGHGFSNAGNGGLLLAPGDGSAGAGVLHGEQLARQDWSRCRLAVLSACSTGTGETRGPVNPESLVRRLLWAGVPRVVASRWNVDAETSVQLMDGFYAALLAGLDVPSALQRSAEHLREQKGSSHPYYWAAFQSFGSR